jgi:hypothetical protein
MVRAAFRESAEEDFDVVDIIESILSSVLKSSSFVTDFCDEIS